MVNSNHLTFSSNQIFYGCVKVTVAVNYANPSVCLTYLLLQFEQKFEFYAFPFP